MEVENQQLKAKIESLESLISHLRQKNYELMEEKEKQETATYWAASDGRITLWTIPEDVANKYDNQILKAFEAGRFGEEWGELSDVFTMDMDEETFKQYVSDSEGEGSDEE